MSDVVKKETERDVAAAERTRNTTTYTPQFDIVETPEELTLFGDFPGVAPEDLDVRFENEHLIVHARVKPRHAGREFLYGEFGIGDFYREFHIAESIDPTQISAELKGGQLVLHLPKSDAVKPRRIQVRAT